VWADRPVDYLTRNRKDKHNLSKRRKLFTRVKVVIRTGKSDMIEENFKEKRDKLTKLKEHVLTILLRKDSFKIPARNSLRKASSEASINSSFSNDSLTSSTSSERHGKTTSFGSPMLSSLTRRFHSPKHIKVQRLKSIDRAQSFTLKPALRRESSFGGSSDSDSATSSPQTNRHVTFSKYALLLAAASENSVEELKALLDKDPSYVNKPSSSGQTPLHKAALKGHLESVQLLVERGADVNFADKQGRTPMFIAWENGHRECFREMLLSSRNVSKEGKNGFSFV